MHPCAQMSICKEPFIAYHNSSSVFPVIDEESLTNLCGKMQNITNCVESIQPPCSDNKIMLYHDQYYRVTKFLCAQGYESYTRHRDCLGSRSIQELGRDCYSVYQDKMAEMKMNRTEEHRKRPRVLMCSAIDDLITCLRDGVTSNCTEDAGQFTHELKSAMFEPVKGTILQCHNLQPGPVLQMQPPIIFIIVFVTVMFAAVLFLVCFAYRHGRKFRSTSLSSGAARRTLTHGSSTDSRSRRRCLRRLDKTAPKHSESVSQRLSNIVNSWRFRGFREHPRVNKHTEEERKNNALLEMAPTAEHKQLEASKSTQTYLFESNSLE